MLASHKKTMTLVVCSVSMFLSSLAYAITHTYDSLNRLTNVRYENGQVIEYKYDSGGNISTIRSMLPTNSAIPSPTSLKAELNADNTILLSWGSVSTASIYEIYSWVQGTSGDVYDQLAVVSGNSYQVMTPGNIKSFKIKACDSTGCSLYSAGFSAGSSVSLADVITVLRILAGISTTASVSDVNSDGKIGLQEAIYMLQVVAGLRN